MQIYIFGAGASSGSQIGVEDTKKLSPLVDNLFSDEYESYARDMKLSDNDRASIIKLLSTHDSSIEEVLNTLWIAARDHPKPLTQSAYVGIFGRIANYLRYLFQAVSETFNETNLYYALLTKLREGSGKEGFISFNYDTLLDRAFEAVYDKTLGGSISVYSNNNYIKPHGSINWLFPPRANDPTSPEVNSLSLDNRLQMSNQSVYTGSVFNIDELRVFSPKERLLNDSEHLHFSSSFKWLYFIPCLLPPIKEKDYGQYGDGFEKTIIQPGVKLLRDAKDIFVIGYQAKDKIFKHMLTEAKPNAKVHVVFRTSRKDVQDRIIQYSPETLSKGDLYSRGFGDFVENKDFT